MQNSNYQQNQNYNQQQQQGIQRQNQNQIVQQQVQNPNSRNVNQSANIHHQARTPIPQNQSFDQYEYQPLYNLGLDVVEQNNGFLIVTGDDIFSKKDSIKACGFRWDGKTKSWYKQIEQQAA